jgi:hypothetical protein
VTCLAPRASQRRPDEDDQDNFLPHG